MTDILKKEISNAITILLIVIVLVIVIALIYNKYMYSEQFINYNDVKTKTLNWCKKMQAVGLLNPSQYDECVSTFKDSTTGVIPGEFTVPDTGLGRNFSLYNVTTADNSNKLDSSISGGNTNNVMMVSDTGYYMGCKPDNTLYFIKDSNDSSINQNELYFTLVPQTNDVYAIMSPYEKYLISNSNQSNNSNNSSNNNNNNVVPITTIANLKSNNDPLNINKEWTASFIGTKIGPMSLWKINKIDNKVTFESIQYPDFFMSFNESNNSLDIIYGSDDAARWLLVPEEKIDENNKYGEYTGVEFIVSAENILQKYKNNNVNMMCLNANKIGLKQLQDSIVTNYNNIAAYMNSRMRSSSVAGLSITDINKVISKINSMAKYYKDNIQTEIDAIDDTLNSLTNDDDVNNTEIDDFILNLQNELDMVVVRIGNNNKIMGRQQNGYEKINKDYSNISKKRQKLKEINKTSNLNINLISSYSKNNKFFIKIYPIIILILTIFLLYLSYRTIIKFKYNIYHRY